MNKLFNVSMSGVGEKIFNITWPNTSIPVGVFNTINNVTTRGNYSHNNHNNINDIKQHLGKNNHKINPLAICSLRDIILKNKKINNTGKFATYGDEIVFQYNTGVDLLILSKQYVINPYDLLFHIWIHTEKYSTNDLKDLKNNKIQPEELLHSDDFAEYLYAIGNDITNPIYQKRVNIQAELNEITFVNYFRSLGIRLFSQSELVEQQIKIFGRAKFTPDILFIDKVYINKQHVDWIEYKDYVGTKVPFLYSSNKDQSAKYFKEWGVGALCYRHSFVSDLSINGAILLDASELPIQLL